MRCLLAIWLLTSCLGAMSAHAQDARSWLERMQEAVRGLNYEGEFVYAHGDQLEAMHIVHRADTDGESERLLSLNGAAREILRDNEVLTCILPDSRSVVVEKSRPRAYIPQALLELDGKLERWYEFAVEGEDRMTGRAAVVIGIRPRDALRYGYRLWLDRDSGMLLKSDLLDENGKAIEQMMFTSLQILPQIKRARLLPEISGRDFKWFKPDMEERAGDEMPHRWTVDSPPPGFMMGMRKEHGLPMKRMPVEHLFYTDGLASVSVYIEKHEQDAPMLDGASRMGAVNAYGRSLGDGHRVTVVGEVPAATVAMMARAVRPKESK